jgi:hypothetical protein
MFVEVELTSDLLAGVALKLSQDFLSTPNGIRMTANVTKQRKPAECSIKEFIPY